MNFEDVLKIVFGSIFVIVIFGFAMWAAAYSFDDCIKVGHTRTYCYLHLGK